MNILKKARSLPKWISYKVIAIRNKSVMFKDLRADGITGVGSNTVRFNDGTVLQVKTSYYETLMLWENVHKKIYEKYLAHTPKIIIDLGAHKGFFSITMARRFPNAHIFAVEASTKNFEYLQENVAQFPNIQTIHAAIFNENTTVQLNISQDHLHSIVKNKSGRIEKVATITLDDLPQADFIKCDVEGAEKYLPFNARNYVALEIEEDQGTEALDYLYKHYRTVHYEPPIAYALDLINKQDKNLCY